VFDLRGVITAYAVYSNGVYKVAIECRDEDSYQLIKKKLRLIGIFVVSEKGKGFE
jgi:hypothetical protein